MGSTAEWHMQSPFHRVMLMDGQISLFSMMMKYLRDIKTFTVFSGKKPTMTVKMNGICQIADSLH